MSSTAATAVSLSGTQGSVPGYLKTSGWISSTPVPPVSLIATKTKFLLDVVLQDRRRGGNALVAVGRQPAAHLFGGAALQHGDLERADGLLENDGGASPLRPRSCRR